MGTTKKSRRKFSNEFKAKVCIESLKEQKTLSELAIKYELHPGVISNWKTAFLNSASGVFNSRPNVLFLKQAILIKKYFLFNILFNFDRWFFIKGLAKINIR